MTRHLRGKPSERSSGDVGRKAAALVELAVCLPLLTLICFGAIETANAVFLKQAIAQVAYEGARVGLQSDAVEADILQRCNDIIAVRRLQGVAVSVSPENVSAATAKGTPIGVTVTVPVSANAFSPLWFFSHSIMTKKVVMTRI
jgi:Flp pilus assembly protein TadG